MTLNCRPGDLAVVVRSKAGNIGKIVQCIRLATDAEITEARCISSLGPVWIIDKQLPAVGTRGEDGAINMGPDACLRPIRPIPDDATDETLTWLPVPVREVA